MIACIAGCLVILSLIPRQGPTPRASVDAVSVAKATHQDKKWDVALAPGVGKPWRPVTATVVPGDKTHPERWQAGYQGEGEDYLAIQQTPSGNAAWVDQVAPGTDEGTVTVDGAVWTKRELSTSDAKALVRKDKLNGLSTLISGHGSWEQLEQFAKAATPFSQLPKS